MLSRFVVAQYFYSMYNLPYYKENDAAVLLAFMQQHSFVFITGTDAAGKPVATQVPVLTEERDGQLYIIGHVMRKTDHHIAFAQNPDVLVVFAGPHAYISASWYTQPQVASTWNYMSVHAKGQIVFTDEATLRDTLQRLTAHFENDDNSPAAFHHLPENYVAPLLKAIVAFEIRVTQLDHVFKLSQNRDAVNYNNIIRRLEQQGTNEKMIAAEMEKRKAELFANQ
jgi:transcriptional regulator